MTRKSNKTYEWKTLHLLMLLGIADLRFLETTVEKRMVWVIYHFHFVSGDALRATKQKEMSQGTQEKDTEPAAGWPWAWPRAESFTQDALQGETVSPRGLGETGLGSHHQSVEICCPLRGQQCPQRPSKEISEPEPGKAQRNNKKT